MLLVSKAIGAPLGHINLSHYTGLYQIIQKWLDLIHRHRRSKFIVSRGQDSKKPISSWSLWSNLPIASKIDFANLLRGSRGQACTI